MFFYVFHVKHHGYSQMLTEEKCQGIRKKLEDLARIGAEVPSSVARVF